MIIKNIKKYLVVGKIIQLKRGGMIRLNHCFGMILLFCNFVNKFINIMLNYINRSIYPF